MKRVECKFFVGILIMKGKRERERDSQLEGDDSIIIEYFNGRELSIFKNYWEGCSGGREVVYISKKWDE